MLQKIMNLMPIIQEIFARILNHQHSGSLRPIKYPKTAKNCSTYMKNYIFGLKMDTMNFSKHKVIKNTDLEPIIQEISSGFQITP